MIGTLVFHLLLLLAFWSYRTPSLRSPVAQTELATFDVQPEPPPPVPPPPVPTPPPPPRPKPKAPPKPREAAPSGSPRPSNAAVAESSNLLLPQIQDVTKAFDAPPLPSPGTSETLAIGLLGDRQGSGTGTGGSGTGDGKGSGAGGGRSTMRGATWLHYPTPTEMQRYWPDFAIRSKISGRALLSCIVPRPGPPKRCRLLFETPPGAGFGPAALRMSHTFRINPVTRDKAMVDMEIRVPVIFNYKEPAKR
ncbi:hypothetical protein EQZ23_11340 [Sphingomonas sp. UV9]|uniref:energy transducer TonB n=1 Tax=Sphingomonas sp. UV9 TaxID=1851410 RepID=UPI000FFB0FFE|nr:energy transducer TonB [Sphingomonas sp. UV9]RXD05634.1 hypothetical protein EQZ23_11340 [Sphingomonas sp. UV9]